MVEYKVTLLSLISCFRYEPLLPHFQNWQTARATTFYHSSCCPKARNLKLLCFRFPLPSWQTWIKNTRVLPTQTNTMSRWQGNTEESARIGKVSFTYKKLSASIIYFWSFQTNNALFYNQLMVKMSFEYPAMGFSLTTFWYESPPLTARPVNLHMRMQICRHRRIPLSRGGFLICIKCDGILKTYFSLFYFRSNSAAARKRETDGYHALEERIRQMVKRLK